MARSDRDAPHPSILRPAAPRRGHPLGSFRPSGGGPPLQRRSGAVARLREATATSAGGVVVRFEGRTPQLVVGMRRRDRDGVTWTLPKGTPIAGETREETALREVAEETGLRVRITEPLQAIEYTFVQRGLRIHKTVHYFLMTPVGGNLARHDHEFEQVRWIDFADAPGLLTFETERNLVRAAAARLSEGAGDAATQRPVATEAPASTRTPDGRATEAGV